MRSAFVVVSSPASTKCLLPVRLQRGRAQELEQRRAEHQKNLARLEAKAQLQQQMIEREERRDQAYQEYSKEKEGVDDTVNRMIAEDQEALRLQRVKQE